MRYEIIKIWDNGKTSYQITVTTSCGNEQIDRATYPTAAKARKALRARVSAYFTKEDL